MKGSSAVTSLICSVAKESVTTAASATSNSSTIMRALVRWSIVSFRKTTPSPCQGEPSRCIASFSELPGLLLEIARVDALEARLLDREPRQAPARRYHRSRRLRPYVAIGHEPEAAGRSFVDRADAGYRRQLFGKSGSFRLHLDREAAAEHLAPELRDRAHERDAASTEQGDAVAHALHPVEQVGRQEH